MASHIGDAMQEFLNEDIPGGGMLTQFFAIGSYMDEDGETCWVICRQEDQTLRDALSLINWAKMDIEFKVNQYLAQVYGEDHE